MTFNYSIKSLKVKGSECCALKDCRGKCSLCPRHTGLQSDSRAQLSPAVTTGGKPWDRAKSEEGQSAAQQWELRAKCEEQLFELCGERMSRGGRWCRCPCSLWEPRGRAGIPCNHWAVDKSPQRTPCWSKLLAEEEPTQELVFWQPVEEPCWGCLCVMDFTPWRGSMLKEFLRSCSPWEGLTLEQFVKVSVGGISC